MFSNKSDVDRLLRELEGVPERQERLDIIAALRRELHRVGVVDGQPESLGLLERALLKLLRSPNPNAKIPSFLRSIGETIRRRFAVLGNVHVQILQPTMNEGSLYVAFSTKAAHRNAPVEMHNSITGRAFRKTDVQYSEDVRQDPDYAPFFDDTLSELAVPVMYGRAPLGVLNIESSQRAAFTEESIMNAQALATLVAPLIAISRFQEVCRIAPTLNFLGLQAVCVWHSVKEEILSTAYQIRKNAAFESEFNALVSAADRLKNLFIMRAGYATGRVDPHALIAQIASERDDVENLIPADTYLVKGMGLRECLDLITSNIDDHCSVGTKVRFTCSASEDQAWLVIQVSDDGPGIDEERLASIRKQMEKEELPGNGSLGLWTIEKNLRVIRGHIDMDSQIGVGTRVSLTVPQCRE